MCRVKSYHRSYVIENTGLFLLFAHSCKNTNASVFLYVNI